MVEMRVVKGLYIVGLRKKVVEDYYVFNRILNNLKVKVFMIDF